MNCTHWLVTVAFLVALAVVPGLSRAQDLEGQQLLDAASNGSGAAVLSLLEKGVSPKVKRAAGRTPLHLAAANGHQATAETLLRYGADINARDSAGKTPVDLAAIGGHSALVEFLQSKGAIRQQALAGSKPAPAELGVPSAATPAPSGRLLKPSLKFRTVGAFEQEIAEPAVLLDSTNVCFFAPRRREKEARIILGYLVKAYDALYDIVGTHTDYKIAVYAFPKGNPHGWGGTSDCSIEYDDSGLDFSRQPDWTQHRVPHMSGYIEEMAHNFVAATKAQFGWEMVGWSLGAEVSQSVAGNPILAADLRATRAGQERTFAQYVKAGCVFPRDLPANQCDRIHAWILRQSALKYGPRFWSDFFREVRGQKQALSEAARLGDGDKIRNARYQITLACFDRLPGLDFKQTLKANGISLSTDVKSLHPETPGWNRRLTE